jgi:hypothetical protein
MASGTGSLDLIEVVRLLLSEDEEIAKAGVFLTFAPNVADVPYVLVQPMSGVGLKTLANTDAWRLIRLQVKSIGAATGNKEGVEVAGELQARVYERFFQTIGEGEAKETAKDRWNRFLHPLGWSANEPMEKGDIGPYSDKVAEIVRWHIGHFADLRISRI